MTILYAVSLAPLVGARLTAYKMKCIPALYPRPTCAIIFPYLHITTVVSNPRPLEGDGLVYLLDALV